jgi:DnaJ like chaperone protein
VRTPPIGLWFLGAAIGFLVSGGRVAGGIFGLAVGVMLAAANRLPVQPVNGQGRRGESNTRGADDFAHVLLILAAHIMKADGKIMRSELEYIRQFFIRKVGPDKANDLVLKLRDLLEQDFSINNVCRQIRMGMVYPLRLELLHFLFGIAAADGSVNPNEKQELERISAYLGVSMADFESIKAMFYRESPHSAYKILEIDPSVSDDEVKKAYRKMAVKYHPDKVSHLGAEFQEAAKEKFQKVQEAYENIRKQRGMA